MYTVTFNKNENKDGTGTVLDTKIVSPPATTTVESLPDDPELDNYVFEGWNTESDGKGEVFTLATVVRGNMTVYAKWWEIPETGSEKLEYTLIDGGTA